MKKVLPALILLFLLNFVFAASNATDDLLAIVYISIGLIFLAIIVVIILIIIFGILKLVSPKVETKKEIKVDKKVETKTTPEPVEKKENPKKEYGDAMKLLRKRFAAGEITKKQFEEMKEALGD